LSFDRKAAATDGRQATMKLLHILVDGPGDLPDRIVEAQSGEHEVEVIDLSRKGISYDAVIDRIFSCDKVVSW
jgi:hypothetical protein